MAHDRPEHMKGDRPPWEAPTGLGQTLWQRHTRVAGGAARGGALVPTGTDRCFGDKGPPRFAELLRRSGADGVTGRGLADRPFLRQWRVIHRFDAGVSSGSHTTQPYGGGSVTSASIAASMRRGEPDRVGMEAAILVRAGLNTPPARMSHPSEARAGEASTGGATVRGEEVHAHEVRFGLAAGPRARALGTSRTQALTKPNPLGPDFPPTGDPSHDLHSVRRLHPTNVLPEVLSQPGPEEERVSRRGVAGDVLWRGAWPSVAGVSERLGGALAPSRWLGGPGASPGSPVLGCVHRGLLQGHAVHRVASPLGGSAVPAHIGSISRAFGHLPLVVQARQVAVAGDWTGDGSMHLESLGAVPSGERAEIPPPGSAPNGNSEGALRPEDRQAPVGAQASLGALAPNRLGPGTHALVPVRSMVLQTRPDHFSAGSPKQVSFGQAVGTAPGTASTMESGRASSKDAASAPTVAHWPADSKLTDTGRLGAPSPEGLLKGSIHRALDGDKARVAGRPRFDFPRLYPSVPAKGRGFEQVLKLPAKPDADTVAPAIAGPVSQGEIGSGASSPPQEDQGAVAKSLSTPARSPLQTIASPLHHILFRRMVPRLSREFLPVATQPEAPLADSTGYGAMGMNPWSSQQGTSGLAWRPLTGRGVGLHDFVGIGRVVPETIRLRHRDNLPSAGAWAAPHRIRGAHGAGRIPSVTALELQAERALYGPVIRSTDAAAHEPPIRVPSSFDGAVISGPSAASGPGRTSLAPASLLQDSNRPGAVSASERSFAMPQGSSRLALLARSPPKVQRSPGPATSLGMARDDRQEMPLISLTRMARLAPVADAHSRAGNPWQRDLWSGSVEAMMEGAPMGRTGETPNAPAEPRAQPGAAALQVDMDELVEKAWSAFLQKLAVEQERRGYSRWP